jgi:replicative DNA helicase
MLDNVTCNAVFEKLVTDDLMRQEHKTLFDEILVMHKCGEPFDVITLQALDIVDRMEMVDSVVSTSSLSYYLKVVKDLSTRRTLIRKLEGLRMQALDTQNELETLTPGLTEMANVLEMAEKDDAERNNIINILDETTANLERQYQNNVELYKKWGFSWIDSNTGGVKPALTILAARPGVGKSAFVINLINNLGKQGVKIAFFGLEMSNEENVIRLMSANGKIQKRQMDEPRTLNDDAWISIGQTAARLSEYSVKMFDDIYDVDRILSKCKQLKDKEGLDFVAIDYLQLLEIQGKFGTTNDKISTITRKLKKFQQNNKIHLMLLSQFNRDSGKQEMPQLHNLRDSGAIEQDADNVWALHNDSSTVAATTPDFVELKLIILKQRAGKSNIARNLKFYGQTMQFFES